MALSAFLEQATGIEPARPAWEAEVLPLNYACIDAPWGILMIFYHLRVLLSRIKHRIISTNYSAKFNERATALRHLARFSALQVSSLQGLKVLSILLFSLISSREE